MSLIHPREVPADDRGLLLGDGIFETVRLYGGRPFRLDAHLARLVRSARALELAVPADLPTRVAAAVEEWGERDGALRITLTRGTGAGLAPPADSEGRVLISITPVPTGFAAAADGLRAVVRGRVDEHALTAGVKAIGYMERIQALRLAQKAGADEALLTNSTGRLVEGSTSNLFVVREAVLHAPGPDAGALPGITRDVLLEAARDAGFPVDEKGVPPDHLTEASEVFLSSSVRELAPVIEVEGMAVGTGRPGPVFRDLATRFRTVVEFESR